MNKICIIGGSGFVGTHLLDNLYHTNIELLNIDKQPSSKYPGITKRANICEIEGFEKYIKGQDLVILLAAEHRDDVRPISAYYDVNVDGTRKVLEAMDKYGVKNIIFTSSVAVYGLNKEAAGEESSTNPFNHYGKSKLQAEKVLKEWQQKDPENRSLTIIRPTVIFGEGNRGNVYTLLHQIARNKFFKIGNGLNKKSMAYVGNVAAFIEFSIYQVKPGFSLYNYVDSPDYDMNELIQQIEKSLNRKLSTFKSPYWLGLTAGWCFDVLAFITHKKLPISSVRVKKFCAFTQFDASKAHASGFKAPFSLSEGLDRTIKYEFIT